MQDLKVFLVQIDQVWENKKVNYSLYESCFQQMEKSDLIILPEMFHTGFSMNVSELAEDWEDSDGLTFLKNWTKKLGSAIYTSLIIKEESNYYNRGVFVFPNGDVVKYDKRKSFGLGGEDKFYTAGNDEVIVELKGWKINLQICYDLRFPELVRNRILQESPAYDVILYVANWPKKRISHWLALLQARAIENQCFVVGVNRQGIDGNNLEYSGDSIVFDALGERKKSAQDSGNQVLSVLLNREDLNAIRSNLPFLKDR
jgi:predicted amidohydrolase